MVRFAREHARPAEGAEVKALGRCRCISCARKPHGAWLVHRHVDASVVAASTTRVILLPDNPRDMVIREGDCLNEVFD